MHDGESSSVEGKTLLSNQELKKILKDNGIKSGYVTKFSSGAFDGPNAGGDSGAEGSMNWTKALEEWRANQPDSVLTPMVEVQGAKWDSLDHLAYAFKTTRENMAERLNRAGDDVYSSRISQANYYRSAESDASNSVSREIWHLGGLASKAGHNIAASAQGLHRIATDEDARAMALLGIQDGWNNLPRIMAKQVDGFSNMTWRQRSDAVITFGFESAGAWGAGKVAGAATKLTYNAGVNTLKSLAPTAGAMLESYMYRSGLLMYAVEPGTMRSVGPEGLRGSSKILADNMGGIPEGYQAHHRVLTSLAQESETLQYLAKNGLYDVNRAANGLALPGDEFLALADDLPLHKGFHGAEYRSAVRDGLNRLDAAFQRGASDASLLRRVDTLENSLADRLLKGELWLNNADAQLRNLGPFGPK